MLTGLGGFYPASPTTCTCLLYCFPSVTCPACTTLCCRRSTCTSFGLLYSHHEPHPAVAFMHVVHLIHGPGSQATPTPSGPAATAATVSSSIKQQPHCATSFLYTSAPLLLAIMSRISHSPLHVNWMHPKPWWRVGAGDPALGCHVPCHVALALFFTRKVTAVPPCLPEALPSSP